MFAFNSDLDCQMLVCSKDLKKRLRKNVTDSYQNVQTASIVGSSQKA